MSTLKNIRFGFITLLLLYSIILNDCISNRGGILVTEYSETLSIQYDKPLIITKSPMINWTLYDNLEYIYDDDYEIQCKQQITNCSCFQENDNNKLCQEFASSLLYTSNEENYEHWKWFEGTDKISAKYKKCINISIGSTFVNKEIKIINSISNKLLNDDNINIDQLNPNIYNQITNEYNKLYSYFRILSMNHDTNNDDDDNDDDATYIDAIQLNILDRIHLSPYFKLFNLNGFDDINDIHIWFGTQYYRAIRHYDKPNNLFFVLKGSRKFKISSPTATIYPLHPFAHKSSRQQYPNYDILEDNEYDKDGFCMENYEMYEVDIYENELLYLPGYWHHEVINNNVSCAISIWWRSKDEIYSKEILDYKLPINPNSDEMTVADVDEFLYFIQTLIDKWCQIIKDQYNNFNFYPLKCLEYNNDGFLLNKFNKIYPLLNDVNYETFEWYAIGMDIENILKCVRTRIEDYGTIQQFKEDLHFCFIFEDDKDEKYKKMWDKSVDDIIDLHLKYSHIGIADLQFIEYIEIILLSLCDDANMIPIWIGFMKL